MADGTVAVASDAQADDSTRLLAYLGISWHSDGERIDQNPVVVGEETVGKLVFMTFVSTCFAAGASSKGL